MTPRRRQVRLLLLVLLAMGIASVWVFRTRPAAGTRQDFSHWQSSHRAEVSRYLAFLDARGAGGVLPAEQLLRLGRRWRDCGGAEFGVPPESLWPNIAPTLRLLGELRKQGLLVDATAASGYRPAAFNRCEGGSAASRHLSNQAIDLDLPASAAARAQALCGAWRRLGPRHHWGLGFYSPTRVHLDTAGFRTWGYDFHRASSLCLTGRLNQ